MTRLSILFWRCADMRWLVLLPLLVAVAACRGDETLYAYGAADKVWRLTELNNQPVSASFTLTFPEAGKLAGTAPCNRFSGQQTVPYPWFQAENIATTKRACPALSAEVSYLAALQAASLSEVLGNTLVLSNPEGLSMVFKAGA